MIVFVNVGFFSEFQEILSEICNGFATEVFLCGDSCHGVYYANWFADHHFW